MNKIKIKNQQGFTLIEVLIYIALVGTVVGNFISFGLSIATYQNKAFIIQEVNSSLREAMGHISWQVKEADQIISPQPGEETDRLIYKQEAAGSNIVISASGNGLYQAEGAGDPQFLTSQTVKVSGISFRNLAGAGRKDSIQVSLSIESGNMSSTPEFAYAQSMQTTATRRK